MISSLSLHLKLNHSLFGYALKESQNNIHFNTVTASVADRKAIRQYRRCRRDGSEGPAYYNIGEWRASLHYYRTFSITKKDNIEI